LCCENQYRDKKYLYNEIESAYTMIIAITIFAETNSTKETRK